MRFLVTGSSGFIGGRMVNFLERHGQDVVKYDIKEDNYPISDVFLHNDIDYIMHFGAISSTTEKDIPRLLDLNYDFTTNLMDICFNLNIPMQFSSSASVYGRSKEVLFKETDPVDILSPYSMTKYLSERYAEKLIKDGARIQCLRYFNVYSDLYEGHKGSQASPQFTFLTQHSKGNPITLFNGSSKIFRDFIHFVDLIEIQYQLAQKADSGIYNIGSGMSQSFLSVAKEISSDVKYIPFPKHLKEHYQYYTRADMTKTWEAIGRL